MILLALSLLVAPATILIGSGTTALVHVHATAGHIASVRAIGVGITTAYQAACAD